MCSVGVLHETKNSASGKALWCVNLSVVLWAMLSDLAVKTGCGSAAGCSSPAWSAGRSLK